MKRMSGRIGIGLGFASVVLGACLTERDGGPVGTDGESVTQAAAHDTQAAQHIVLAMRGQLQRAMLPVSDALTNGAQSTPQSLDLIGATASAETINVLAPNGLLNPPQFKTNVTLAPRANGAFRVTDGQSRMSVDVSLRGATNAIREDVDGYSVYRSGYAHHAHVMHRTFDHGTEDYVFFPEELPSTPELHYDIALGEDVAGLRLVDSTLEMLDKGGAPRLRMNPPYAVDGDGKKITVNVAIEGCAYDSSGAMPWGRPTVDPGNRQCTVHLTWDASAKAPLVVDPSWVDTMGTLGFRINMTATVVGDKVIVAGGEPAIMGPLQALDRVEYYDALTMTWALGRKLPAPRTDHSAIFAQVGGKSYLYIMGGRNSTGAIINEVFRYDSMADNWMLATTMLVPLAKHTSTQLSDQRVLLAGGQTTGSVSTDYSMLYNPVDNTWSPKLYMNSARNGHTATLIQDKYVLVAGGRDNNGAFLSSMELYTPGDSPWSPVTTSLSSVRARHAAVRLKDGSVMFVGGETTGEAPFTAVDVCTFDVATKACTWATNIPQLAEPRTEHGVAYLQHMNEVVVLGGRAHVDLMMPLVAGAVSWVPGGAAWKPFPAQKLPRRLFLTVQPSPASMMVIGGFAGLNAPPTGTAELYTCSSDADCSPNGEDAYCSAGHFCKIKKPDGNTCDVRAASAQGVDCLEPNCGMCKSGHCVDGVCCNSACEGSCEACNQNGNCKPIIGAPRTNQEPGDFNLPLRDACSDDPECGGSCNGILRTCNYPASGTVCETACVEDKVQVKSCDGKGACGCPDSMGCKYDQIESCAPYVCDSATQDCHVGCTPALDKDPQVGCDENVAVCNVDTKECVSLPTKCEEDTNSMRLPNGTLVPCGNFQCIAGACLTVCNTAYDCLPDVDGNGNRKYVCDDSRRCVPAGSVNTTGESDVTCSTAPANQSSRFGWLAALALAGAFASRRNRARA